MKDQNDQKPTEKQEPKTEKKAEEKANPLDGGVQYKSEKDLIEGLISFGISVRGALNTKTKVQQAWNELIEAAVKIKNQNKK